MGLRIINENPSVENKKEEGIVMSEEDIAHLEGKTVSPDVEPGKAVDAAGEQRIGYQEEPSQEEIDRGNESLGITAEAGGSFTPEKEELTEADAFFAKHDLRAVFDEYQNLNDLPEVKNRIMTGIKPQIDSFLEINNARSLSETSRQNIIRVIVRNLDKLK